MPFPRLTARRSLRVLSVACALAAVPASFTGPAYATVDGAVARIDVQRDLSACGRVSDGRRPGSGYTATLTASGFQTALASSGVVSDSATSSGNPATPCTRGGFAPFFAQVAYTLNWTGPAGEVGASSVTCTVALIGPICTLQ